VSSSKRRPHRGGAPRATPCAGAPRGPEVGIKNAAVAWSRCAWRQRTSELERALSDVMLTRPAYGVVERRGTAPDVTTPSSFRSARGHPTLDQLEVGHRYTTVAAWRASASVGRHFAIADQLDDLVPLPHRHVKAGSRIGTGELG
jgi:hypothetical protein